MKIHKNLAAWFLVEHGKNIEKIRNIAKSIENKKVRIKKDSLLVEDIVWEFQGIVNALTKIEIDGKSERYINSFYSYLLQSIVSTNIEIDKLSDFFRWLLINRTREAIFFLQCLASKLDEPCGQIIYNVLLESDDKCRTR